MASLDSIAQQLQELAAQVQAAQPILEDLKAGRKRLAIVPGSGPSLVVATPGKPVQFGIPALPILAAAALVGYLAARRVHG